MSKELIERLISYIPNGDGHNSQYANDLADAVVLLEAKAAPVGEREAFESKYPFAKNLVFKDGCYVKRHESRWQAVASVKINGMWHDFQAGAAYQRQQAREVVMPPFAQKVISKLQRFQECAEDGEDTDIGRSWLDLLTRLALLNRVQRSPALWEISQQGEDVLDSMNKGAGSHE